MTATTAATPAQLAAYLARIGFAGIPRADLDTLTAIHRAHVESFAWNCIDAFVGRATGRDPAAAFVKIVEQGRGGWCYEMNGLLAAMLEAIGFRLTRLAAAVMRDELGEVSLGNHLMMIVHLDRDYIADVGLGSGLVEPIPFAAGRTTQRGSDYALEPIAGGWWRFHNRPGVLPPYFDFSPDIHDEALLDGSCRWLQTDPASPFRQNLVVQRYTPHGLDSLVGRSLTRRDASGETQREIATAAELDTVLRERFGLSNIDTAAVWTGIEATTQPA